MDKWIIAHSGALRVFGNLTIPFALGLIFTAIMLLIIKKRQAANQRLESSKGKTRFAQACSRNGVGRNVQRFQVRSASNATRRMTEASGRAKAASRPPEVRSSGPSQRMSFTNPAQHIARARITEQDPGVTELCFEYLDQYRI